MYLENFASVSGRPFVMAACLKNGDILLLRSYDDVIPQVSSAIFFSRKIYVGSAILSPFPIIPFQKKNIGRFHQNIPEQFLETIQANLGLRSVIDTLNDQLIKLSSRFYLEKLEKLCLKKKQSNFWLPSARRRNPRVNISAFFFVALPPLFQLFSYAFYPEPPLLAIYCTIV